MKAIRTGGTHDLLVVQGGSDARYLPTGHVVYALRDGVFGVAFDADRLKVTGGAVALVQDVQRPVGVNAAASNYAVSEQGTLVYLARSRNSLRSLAWMNRPFVQSKTGCVCLTVMLHYWLNCE